MCVVVWTQGGGGSEPSDEQPPSSGSRTERSLEESRKLILEWAGELRHVDEVSVGSRRAAPPEHQPVAVWIRRKQKETSMSPSCIFSS